MKKIISLLLMGLLLSGCSLFRTHKMDIDQGNIITEANVKRLHKGMSQDQVESIMGSPVLRDIFSEDRTTYLYTFQPGYGPFTEKRVICHFKSDRLIAIEASLPPTLSQPTTLPTEEKREKLSLALSHTLEYGVGKIQNSYKKLKSLIW